MTTFLSNVPIWVFPLFILLLILGLRASKDRKVPIALIAALPLLGILTLRNILALAPPNWIWLVAAAAYAIGIAAGMVWQRGWIVERSPRIVQVKGEWVTLTAMMIIFAAGFVNGFLSAVMPQLTQFALFATLFTVVTCLPAGQFLGRAITTLRTPISEAS
jgi:hypothetical protein